MKLYFYIEKKIFPPTGMRERVGYLWSISGNIWWDGFPVYVSFGPGTHYSNPKVAEKICLKFAEFNNLSITPGNGGSKLYSLCEIKRGER